MRPCTKVGLDVTWRCNWNCAHCFYRRNPQLHQPVDVPLEDLEVKVRQAWVGGLDHAVMVGYGEPTLYPKMRELLTFCRGLGMATSIITNGTAPIEKVQGFYDCGLDHLHFSTHGTPETLARITGHASAGARQAALKVWLASQGRPWRTNIAVQQLNYRELPAAAAHELNLGARHYVFLGFLPHYEWGRDPECVRAIAPHPAEVRPFLQTAARAVLERGVMMTIRYTPMCHLDPDLWPYVTNARHVFMDPFEWNYELQATDFEALWKASVRCGQSVACSEPCRDCLAYEHCGGWNRVMAAAYDGAGLAPIREIPAEYADVWNQRGGLHDLNPANAHTGTFGVPAKAGG